MASTLETNSMLFSISQVFWASEDDAIELGKSPLFYVNAFTYGIDSCGLLGLQLNLFSSLKLTSLKERQKSFIRKNGKN